MSGLTHTDAAGRVRMVDVTDKNETDRTATAAGEIRMRPETFRALMDGRVTKGNVLETARIAGVMAAKRTGDLIPMCHPLMLTHVSVDFFPEETDSRIRIEATARLRGRTGVEMEALTAVSAAALTIYDMLKAVDKDMEIGRIRLMAKDGGKSGAYRRAEASAE